MWKRKRIGAGAVICLLVCVLSLLCGCENIRLTIGYRSTEFIRYEGQHIGMDRALLLLGENRASYEQTFDLKIWEQSMNGIPMEQYVKDVVKDTIEHLMILRKSADRMDITLTQEEKNRVAAAAEKYIQSCARDKELPYTQQTVEEYYTDLLLAQKVFYAVTKDVDTEVSTDEARIIDVQYLFFSGYERLEDGTVQRMPENDAKKIYQKAVNVLEMLREGAELTSLVTDYSDDTEFFLELGRGERDLDFENAAFALEMGEISEVVWTAYGWYIIKCTNDNVSGDYDRRKESIVMARRTELFAAYYAENTQNIETHYNDEFWTKYKVEDVTKGSGQLQSIFDEYFR